MAMGRWVWPALVLFSLSLFLFWSNQPRFRHGFVAEIQTCSVLQLAQLPKGADFLAIGSSRVLMGLQPETVEAASAGHVLNVYNLGRVRRSIERSYSIFRDLLEAGLRPRYVFLEVSQDRLAARSRDELPLPRDAAFLRYGDAFHYLEALPGIPWVERVHFAVRHIIRKMDMSIRHVFSGAALEHSLIQQDSAPKVCRGDESFLVAPGHARAIAHQKRIFQARHGDLSIAVDDSFRTGRSQRTDVELYFIELVRELARQHDVTLLVGMYWRAFQPPLSERALVELRELVPELVYPPPELVRSSWDGFVDKGHMDAPARHLYSEWLGQLLAQRGSGVR
jgi:hypothetical protein